MFKWSLIILKFIIGIIRFCNNFVGMDIVNFVFRDWVRNRYIDSLVFIEERGDSLILSLWLIVKRIYFLRFIGKLVFFR